MVTAVVRLEVRLWEERAAMAVASTSAGHSGREPEQHTPTSSLWSQFSSLRSEPHVKTQPNAYLSRRSATHRHATPAPPPLPATAPPCDHTPCTWSVRIRPRGSPSTLNLNPDPQTFVPQPKTQELLEMLRDIDMAMRFDRGKSTFVFESGDKSHYTNASLVFLVRPNCVVIFVARF